MILIASQRRPIFKRRAGTYPEVPGERRFVVSPNALLVYDVEVLPNQ